MAFSGPPCSRSKLVESDPSKLRSGPVLVELFGQPGAGKTTLAHAAAANSSPLSVAAVNSVWRRRSLFRKGATVVRALAHLSCVARAAQLVIKARLFNSDSLSRLVRLIVKSQWLRSQTGSLLLEEGSLQSLWSIFYSADRLDPDPRLLAPLVRCLYRGVEVRIVYIQQDSATAVSRICGRKDGKSRLDGLPEPLLQSRLAATAKLAHSIAEGARAAGLEVDVMDGAASSAELVSQLRSIVASSTL